MILLQNEQKNRVEILFLDLHARRFKFYFSVVKNVPTNRYKSFTTKPVRDQTIVSFRKTLLHFLGDTTAGKFGTIDHPNRGFSRIFPPTPLFFLWLRFP